MFLLLYLFKYKQRLLFRSCFASDLDIALDDIFICYADAILICREWHSPFKKKIAERNDSILNIRPKDFVLIFFLSSPLLLKNIFIEKIQCN